MCLRRLIALHEVLDHVVRGAERRVSRNERLDASDATWSKGTNGDHSTTA
jgi:hypothetical protein